MKSFIFSLVMVLGLLFFSTNSAQANPALFYPQKWDVKHFEFALGARFDTVLKKRGVILYDSWQVLPVFSFSWFTPQLTLAGTTLHYRHRFSDYFLLRSRFSFSSTPKALYSTGGVPKNSVRASSMEWDTHLEFGIPELGEIKLTYSQDVKAHKGSYLEAQARWIITKFDVSKYTVYPAIYSLIGAGSGAHNQYFYGTQGSSFGANNYAMGVSLTVSPNIDHFFPVFQFERYGILGAANKAGTLVGANTSGWYLRLLFAFRIL